MKTIRLIALALMLAVAGNANAVIRSPFPTRPSAPYQVRVFQSIDSLTVAPKTVKHVRSR